jgi:hypothetical protein
MPQTYFLKGFDRLLVQRIAMRKLVVLLIVLFCLSPVQAELDQTEVHVLYSLEADVDADGVPERLVVVVFDRADPTQQGDKAFWVLKRDGEKFNTVYDSGRSDGAFDNRMAMWQVLSPESVPPGISVIQDGQGYPMIRVCFTPNSDHLVDYRFNGKTFVIEYPVDL